MINYIETHITDHCNLRCEGCSHFSCFAKRDNVNIFQFEDDVKRLSEFGVGTFRIMGGEPTLHPMWLGLCISARKLLGNATNIELVTNGLNNDEINKCADKLNEYRISVCQSMYGVDTPELHGIQLTKQHSKGKMYNISLDLEGKRNAVNSYEHCDLARYHWYFLRNGKLYNCCVMGNIHIFNSKFGTNIDGSDAGISIYGNTEEEIKRYLNTPHEACKYCDTMKREHSYHAFGVTKGEISEWIR